VMPATVNGIRSAMLLLIVECAGVVTRTALRKFAEGPLSKSHAGATVACRG